MPLDPGTTLGPYSVIAKIGEGGMGEVYRARDTNLDRHVALKVLPYAFTEDPDRLARFEREARVLASLNHPNIGGIYGLEEAEGQRALVLELVEGPTLADRINEGPIPVDEALPIAKQVAEALEAAHEQGIIHRDLKPANIKVKPDGTVKVLDFGLAKALDTTPEGDPSQSPTLTAATTQMGMVIGTAAYMAPEQARGKPVDKRADIWAFGTVLFEMVTGSRAFEGEDVSVTLANVINQPPDWRRLPGGLSPSLQIYLRRCLEKDPKQRVADMQDVRLALDGAFETVGSPSSPAGRQELRAWQRPRGAAALGLALVATSSLIVWGLKPSSPLEPGVVSRFSVSVPPSVPVAANSTNVEVAITPDGSRVVYRGEESLHIRDVDQLEAVSLRGAVGGNPFISPDGAWIGFQAGGALQKVSIEGGPPVTICQLPGPLRGASWGDNDIIVFAALQEGLFRVPATGGEPEVLVDGDYRWPDVLPGSGHALFSSGEAGARQVRLLDVESKEHEVIISSGTRPRYARSGHIVYGLQGTLRAVAFDADSLTVVSDPVTVVEDVLTRDTGSASFDLSETGSLAYVSGGEGAGVVHSVVWVDRDGREDPVGLPAQHYRHPRLSPDGSRLAVTVQSEGPPVLWVYDLASGRGLPLTQDYAWAPLWTPGGERVVFGANHDGPENLYWIPSDGSGQIEALTVSESGKIPTSVTPDGRMVLFTRSRPGPSTEGLGEIWQVPLQGERRPSPVLQGEIGRGLGEVSPDGAWLAYRSDQSGQMEIYVQPYERPGPTVPVSVGGGDMVTWSIDGSELFYRAGNRMMAVSVTNDGSVGAPTVLFEGDYFRERQERNYHVGPDGRFIMIKRGDIMADEQPLVQVVLVQNWFRELTELVASN